MYYNTEFKTYLLSLYIFFFLFTKICQSIETAGGDEDRITPDSKDVQELSDRLTKTVEDWGFKLKTYEVLALDDYILKVHRMFKDENNLKPPVLIMHGTRACSPTYLAIRDSIAYYLAERGYDVWVGNARGTIFSKKHKTLNPKKKQYWDFSFHEMGYFDLPAFLRKIKQVTGQARVHYVGFSMGTTEFLVMATTHVALVKDDIASVSLVAPVARPSNYFKVNTKTKRFVKSLAMSVARFVSKGDIHAYHKSVSMAIYKACSSPGLLGKICERKMRAKYNKLKAKGDPDLYDFRGSLEVLPYFPCGLSIKTYQHYTQLASAGTFQEFDYGKRQNQKRYGKISPPEYDLGAVDKKINLLVGGNDGHADKRDIKWLHERLKNSVFITEKFEKFSHHDFEYGTEKGHVNEEILKIIEDFEKNRKTVQ